MFSPSNLRIAEYEPHAAMAPHRHDDASFGVIVSGDFVERIGRGERNYATGCVSFGPAGIVHSQSFGAMGARQIIFRPQDAWLAYLADCRLGLDDAPYVHAAIFRELGQRLLNEMHNDDDFSLVACEGIVLEIVAAFGRAGTVVSSSPAPPAWLRRARDFMQENAFSPIGMKQIARAAGRHEIHLAREFRRFFGVSIGAYLRQLKAERAADLLLHARTDITEIALHCGFASHSHLCRVFKAHFGITPSQYRARH
jgi:AraC family transcriptional regulator